MSVAEVARFCGLSEKAVRRAIDEGELPASKLRSRLRVRPEDVDAWIAAGAARPRVSQVRDLSRPHRRPLGPFRTLMRDESNPGELP